MFNLNKTKSLSSKFSKLRYYLTHESYHIVSYTIYNNKSWLRNCGCVKRLLSLINKLILYYLLGYIFSN